MVPYITKTISILKQWDLHVHNTSVEDEYWLNYIINNTESQHLHAVVIFPSTEGSYQNDIVKLIVRESAILAQRYISFPTLDAADIFVQQLYQTETWVDNGGSRKRTDVCFSAESLNTPTWILFIQTRSPLSTVLSLKEKIRNLFHKDTQDFKSKQFVHISETNAQTASIAKVVLNQNSLWMIREMRWTSPSMRRQKNKCATPTSQDQSKIYFLDDKPCAFSLVVI